MRNTRTRLVSFFVGEDLWLEFEALARSRGFSEGRNLARQMVHDALGEKMTMTDVVDVRLTPLTVRLLRLLEAEGPKTSRQLAKGLGASTIAIHQNVDRMLGSLLVIETGEFVSSGAGRPARLLGITAFGLAQLEQATTARDARNRIAIVEAERMSVLVEEDSRLLNATDSINKYEERAVRAIRGNAHEAFADRNHRPEVIRLLTIIALEGQLEGDFSKAKEATDALVEKADQEVLDGIGVLSGDRATYGRFLDKLTLKVDALGGVQAVISRAEARAQEIEDIATNEKVMAFVAADHAEVVARMRAEWVTANGREPNDEELKAIDWEAGR